jgi:transcriptional antiterminator RfaH
MSANWYAVTTRPQKEKKVASLLSKLGLECFCPTLQIPQVKSVENLNPHALFRSCIFVWTDENWLKKIQSLPWVVNFLYWKSKPATFPSSEIDLFKDITQSFSLVGMEKTEVQAGAPIRYLDEPSLIYHEKTLHVQYNKLRVKLPTLGCILTAERLKVTPETAAKSRRKIAGFPQKLNAFLFA